MASAKRLGQLLQEQQEPFTLNAYLLERGYSRSHSNSATKFHNGSNASLKFLKWSASYGINKRNKVIPSCSKIVKAVFNKLVVSIKTPTDTNVITMGRKSSRELAMEERISSASRTTVFNSCSESDTDSPNKGQVDADRKFKRRCMEDNKQQLSPISVLEGALSNQNSPTHNEKQRTKTRKVESSTVCNNGKTKKKADKTIFSVSLCKLLEQSSTEKPIHNNLSSDYIKIKLVLRETKQLLFDCVSEAIETNRLKKRKQRRHVKEFLGAEEIGKLLHENVMEWCKQTTNGTNTTRLLTVDLLANFEEWSDLEQQRKEIATAIGNSISEDLINEIVADMVSCPATGSTQVRRHALV